MRKQKKDMIANAIIPVTIPEEYESQQVPEEDQQEQPEMPACCKMPAYEN